MQVRPCSPPVRTSLTSAVTLFSVSPPSEAGSSWLGPGREEGSGEGGRDLPEASSPTLPPGLFSFSTLPGTRAERAGTLGSCSATAPTPLPLRSLPSSFSPAPSPEPPPRARETSCARCPPGGSIDRIKTSDNS